jgi:hypothetical protein
MQTQSPSSVELDERSAPISREGGGPQTETLAKVRLTNGNWVAPVRRKVERQAPAKSRKRLIVAMAAVVLLALAATALYLMVQDEPIGVGAPPAPTSERSRDEILRDLVNRNLIPEQALDPEPRSREEILRDLVNRNLIPEQALDPEPRSRDEVLRDLVNRNLIPEQALGG